MTVDREDRLGELLDRQDILDCIMRYARAVDRLDRDLLLSVYHRDAIDDHGTFACGPGELADFVLDMHSRLHQSHQHCILNHTCELAGDVAYTETYFMFAGINRQGRPLTLSGGRYVDRFERRDGRWAIAHRLCLRDWGLIDERPEPGDLAGFAARRSSLPSEVLEFVNAGPAPARDRTDPSYSRPFVVDRDRVATWRRVAAGAGH